MLMTAMRVFEHIHELVFQRMKAAPLSVDSAAAATWDIRNIMADEKRQVSSKTTYATLMTHQ